MSTSKKKMIAKVASLSDSLDQLEAKLEPLFMQTLPETLVSLDTLQQAKMQVLLPYLINDLIFIYLRARGVDPKTHTVVAELDRVRQYFAKIKDAEDPDKKRTEVDKAAAGRFIRHAITQAKYGKNLMPNAVHTKFGDDGNPIPSVPAESTSSLVPKRVTSKMLEREMYERDLKEMGNETDEEMLEVFDEGQDHDEGEEESSQIGQGKEMLKAVGELMNTDAIGSGMSLKPGAKRRKRPMDPFGELSEEQLTAGGSEGPYKKVQRIANIEAKAMSDLSGISTPLKLTTSTDNIFSDRPKKREKRKGKGQSKDTED